MLIAASCAAGDDFKSGPQVGERLPGPFHPYNINGKMAGRANCLV
jgi:hypothetical protein